MELREFEHKFNILYLPLGMYALRMVEEVAVSQDLVQDAFVKAWELVSGGAEIDNFKAWMYRSVHNLCVDYLRRRRQYENIDSLQDFSDERVDTSERDARVWKAIGNLPERCREIFLMSKRDGLSNEEIAEEMNLSVKTVKNQMTKAFARLREELADGHRPFFLPFL
ncbi:MAG: RNA polymerase sigma-70 factor [Muribaculaceae bacterium]|nr:RNA polymerase sigma-70 factor [Muribaculaceae bacterium]MDE6130892.1 RNA polymerase sigma-70 factor [Muribaculaceae bacterium]